MTTTVIISVYLIGVVVSVIGFGVFAYGLATNPTESRLKYCGAGLLFGAFWPLFALYLIYTLFT